MLLKTGGGGLETGRSLASGVGGAPRVGLIDKASTQVNELPHG